MDSATGLASCMWGSVCKGCSPIAKMKLAAYRASAVTIGVPAVAAAGTAVVAVGLSGAAVVAAAPAVVCAPLAAVYEPVRRLRKKGKNPFKEQMGVGARLVAQGAAIAIAVLVNDSD